MNSLVPEVHLFICLDTAIKPGPVLQCLDYIRAQNWQNEAVLICDVSWKKYISPDQPILFLDRSKLFSESGKSNSDMLEALLEELDRFEISRVTQLGELSWARWLKAYIDDCNVVEYNTITIDSRNCSSVQLMNDISDSLSLDISLPVSERSKSSTIYIDPYVEGVLSENFITLISSWGEKKLPDWVQVVAKEEDVEKLVKLGVEEAIVDFTETEINLFNQYVLCFSDDSPFAQASRSYNVALYDCDSKNSLFVQGDIIIRPGTAIHLSELLNIMIYWRTNRLKELAFQWLNMGIEVETLEFFHNRLVTRNLLNYSSDLYHCQMILDEFKASQGLVKKSSISSLVHKMKQSVDNDPYSLSFSLKILVMIVERMLSSAQCGERLFQRLGSDYHRIIIGEALIENIIELQGQNLDELDLKKVLKGFLNYLLEIDFINDKLSAITEVKESL